MLTSITPLGERGRGQRWKVTATWLFLGHLAGGAILGGVLAGIGLVVWSLAAPPDGVALTSILAVVVLSAVVFDLAGGRIPGRRQVDERWLTAYRGWVYGGGFGLQLGFGLVTVVNTALVGAVVVAGILLPASEAVAIGVVYGAVRGVTAIANGRVRSVGGLRRLHAWIDRAEGPVRWGGAAIATAAAVGALVAA